MTRTSAGSTDTTRYPTPAASLARLFHDRVAATPDAEAFRFPAAGGWESVTWAQVEHPVETMAAGLLALGIQPEERVAIASSTRVEWVYADLAVVCAGGATTTVYPSTVAEGVAFILSDSGSRVVFAEDDASRTWFGSSPSTVRRTASGSSVWRTRRLSAQMLEAVQLQVGFPTAIDGRVDKIAENLAVVRPTFMAGPPRIFEKVHSKVVQTIEEQGGLRYQLFKWAFGVGDQVAQSRLEQHRPKPSVQAEFLLADRLVLSQIRNRLGGRIRFLVSGSAALSSDVARWFHAAGLPILEGHALTETSSGACITRLDGLQVGVVGPPLAGTEIKVAADGEVYVDDWQGRGVATALLEVLMRQRPKGVQRIVTVINADNAASLAMLRRRGEVEVSQVGSGTRHVVVELPGTADFPDRPGCGRRSVPRVV